MKIIYNEKDKTIEINDGLKSHFLLIKILMLLILINSVINLIGIVKTGLGFMEIIWLFLGTISVVVLYSLYFKESSLEKIPITKIKRLMGKTSPTKKQYYFELVDGKKRVLKELKTDKDSKELRKLLTKLGIEN
ncbi:hypothetical protein [Flavobacterium sp.]|jgi:hypothetical protein|uniref:hypothetical protein n=1 Tax=Flavobacterium sp. TaxID=239 RepID=UPI002BDC5C6D|nr:hypothetical protein [Flavobacterium sp.]MCA0348298.1 hypothetical protein [Bacteroidota bacterium]HQA74494.1 hypothetical protein [Flavobacterium sp.]